MVIQNALAFFLTPFMLGVLGNSEYGVYRLVLSMASYFALADLGLSNAIVRYVSEYRARGDKRSESRFIALIMSVDVLAGLLVIIAGAGFYRFIPGLFQNSFAGQEIQLLQRLFILLVVSGVLSLFLNLTTGVMKSYGEFGLLKTIDIARSVVRALSVVVLLLSGYHVFAVVLVDTVLTLLTLVITASYCLRKLRVGPSFKSLTFPYAREILQYSLVVFVDALAFYLLNSADAMIIGIKISSAAVAVYSIGVQISSMFHALSIVISDVLMPEVVVKVATNQTNDQLTDYMIRIGRIKLLVLALPTIGFALLGRSFVTLWVGPQYIEAFYVALIVIIPSMLAGIGDVGLYVMWAKRKHKTKSAVSLVIAGINIVISIVLVDSIGLLGAAIGTSIAWILGYNIFNSIYFHKVLKLDMRRFYAETFSGVWIAMAGAAICAGVVGAVGGGSWAMFAARVAVVSAVYIGLAWRVALNDSEKVMARSVLRTRRDSSDIPNG